MNERERIKALLPIMTAYANGENVQFLNLINTWEDLVDADFSHGPERYRVKPKLKYRAYTTEEAERFVGKVIRTWKSEPYLIHGVSADGKVLVGSHFWTTKELWEGCWTMDGKPFAAEVTQ